MWCASELDRSPRWKMSAPTTLLAFCHAREVTGYCPAGVQGTVIGITVDLGVLPYFLRLFPGPYRVGVPGRLVLVGSDCASRRGVVCRGSAHPRSEKRVGVGSGVWPGLPVGEAVRRRAGVGSKCCSSLVRPSGRRGGTESEPSILPPQPGLPVGVWITLMPCRLGTWAGPRVARWFATLSAGPSLFWEAGR